MILDSFLFFNEYELLELRLAEHADVVDQFILVEQRYTHQGELNTNLGNWKLWGEGYGIIGAMQHRIKHIVIDLERPTGPWKAQANARNAILNAVQPSDLLLYSDADEIVRGSSLREATANMRPGISWVFDLTDYYYTFDWKVPIQMVWERPALARVSDITTVEELRSQQAILPHEKVLNAGWHFSCLGDEYDLRDKLKAFTHSELNTPEHTDLNRLHECIKTGTDLLIPPRFQCEPVEVDDTYPQFLRDHIEDYTRLLRER